MSPVQIGPEAPHIDSVVSAGGALTLSFLAQAGQSYSVLASDSLAPASWQFDEREAPSDEPLLSHRTKGRFHEGRVSI